MTSMFTCHDLIKNSPFPLPHYISLFMRQENLMVYQIIILNQKCHIETSHLEIEVNLWTLLLLEVINM